MLSVQEIKEAIQLAATFREESWSGKEQRYILSMNEAAVLACQEIWPVCWNVR